MNELLKEAMQALKEGKNDTFKALIANKSVDPNFKDDDGYGFIHYAARIGNAEAIEILFKAGVNINDNDNSNKFSPLFLAIHADQLEVVKKLHELKADMNLEDAFGLAPITRAIKSNRTDIANFLIKNYEQVNLNLKDRNGYSLLHWAVDSNIPTQTISWLYKVLSIKYGLNINLKDEDGNTPLHIAAVANNATMIKHLIKLGADPSIANNANKQPIHIAIAQQAKKSIKLLSAHTKDFNPDDYDHDLKLSIVFNNINLNANLENKNNGVRFDSGGYIIQFIQLAIPHLEQFLAHRYLDVDFKDLISRINHMSTHTELSDEDLLDQLINNGSIILSGGYDIHYVPTVINKNSNGEWQLTIIDRGFFAQASDIENKTYPVRSIIIPEDKLAYVIATVRQAKRSSEEEASKIIFKDIPAELGNDFVVNKNVIQKFFKNDQCFFENFKSLILYELVQKLGTQKGHALYKEFDLYLHKKVFKEYKRYHQNENKPYLDTVANQCNEIISKKEKQLTQSNFNADIWSRNQKLPEVESTNIIQVRPTRIKHE